MFAEVGKGESEGGTFYCLSRPSDLVTQPVGGFTQACVLLSVLAYSSWKGGGKRESFVKGLYDNNIHV